ncbi:hypothetical protein [Sulfurimonas paralvinellae]|uniref:Uncharacterized protein n=1 Tax=Sulfurimonas paralvinellae TaxID=317658 RepID=A0A7M1B8J0_9BACT|nr:hypothetical protein [Sulfurimonas paralvinellae]QOP46024.1 hypothetical protein FM071_06825 [Sulfurimonas paralvinellae]
MKKIIIVLCVLLSSASYAVEYDLSVGVHDFIVQDIKNDVPQDGLPKGTSHTLGLNTAIYVKHVTQNGISLAAKIEAFIDRDKDHLDPDHYSVWFDAFVKANGPMYTINEKNRLNWHLLMDNRQNTVSSVEREVRQHVGVGYLFDNNHLSFGANLYFGFYYIEFDDDVPVSRGYERQDLDDGESSSIVEFTGKYAINKDFVLTIGAKQYSANTGFEKLEQDYEFHAEYGDGSFLSEGAKLNLKVKYVKYDLSRFYRPDIGVSVLPFDNDMIVQAYITVPIQF